MAAVFDFIGGGMPGRERNLYQGGGRRSKNKERGRGGEVKIPLPPIPTVHLNTKFNKRWRAYKVSSH